MVTEGRGYRTARSRVSWSLTHVQRRSSLDGHSTRTGFKSLRITGSSEPAKKISLFTHAGDDTLGKRQSLETDGRKTCLLEREATNLRPTSTTGINGGAPVMTTWKIADRPEWTVERLLFSGGKMEV
jgi:hypothetical protein